MGSRVSKDAGFEAQLHFYKDACKTYPDVKIFEDLKEQALDALPTEGFSLDFLKQITSCFLDVDQNVAKLILENKKYIWNTPDLKEIVNEYFDNSLETLKFCEELVNCLKRARSEQLKLQIALKHIAPEGSPPGKEQYAKIVEKLNDFKAAPNPFTWDFFMRLDILKTRHSRMLETLAAKRTQLENKRWWIKCWSAIFGATFTAAVICCYVVAAIVPGLACLIPAMNTTAQSFSLIASSHADRNKRQLEVLNAMENGSFAKLEDLKGIRVRVEGLVNSHHSILENVELCLGDEHALLIAVEDVRSEQRNFMIESQNLIDHVAKCSQNLGLLRNLVLCGIKQP